MSGGTIPLGALAQVEQEPDQRRRVLELAAAAASTSASVQRTTSSSSPSSGSGSPSSRPSATKTVTRSLTKPGDVQKDVSSRQLPPRRPVSSRSSRCAVSSGFSPCVDQPRRQLEQLAARRHAALADEDDALFGVDGHDRDRVRRVGDLVAVLDEDGEALPLPDPLHRASPSTYARSSRPNHGGSPAAAFSAARSGREVAGMTRSTRGSESAHLSSACGQVLTPNGASGRELLRLTAAAQPALPRRTAASRSTATPSSAASGSSTCSHVALARVERHLQRLEAPRSGARARARRTPTARSG